MCPLENIQITRLDNASHDPIVNVRPGFTEPPIPCTSDTGEDCTLVECVSADSISGLSTNAFNSSSFVRGRVIKHSWRILHFGSILALTRRFFDTRRICHTGTILQVHVFHLAIDSSNKSKVSHTNKRENVVDPNIPIQPIQRWFLPSRELSFVLVGGGGGDGEHG